ncbi:RHS repeat-associated core domain-containing protein [Streptomyces sp. NPDC056670]|uniref:RHS repeat-associated core domain-containing protein n=1 Tax=Streptomyces sp. NPDC056670 TaxID=3345904 RepID=UPI0036AD470B
MTLVAYLLTGLLGGPVAAAAGLSLSKAGTPDPVPTKTVKGKSNARVDEAAQHAWKSAPKTTWPAPGTARTDIPEAGVASKAAGSLPVRLGRTAQKKGSAGRSAAGPEQAQVQVLDQETAQKLGVDGVLLAVKPSEGAQGSVDVQVDYSAFRGAYGGDWASRLKLRQLPACALTSPGDKNCATGKELPTDNNAVAGTLTAPVVLPSAQPSPSTSAAGPVQQAPSMARSMTGLSAANNTVLLAATASVSGSAGNFGATSLAPSASWSAGGSNGGFSWKYGIDTPDVAGGVQPDLALSYSSQSVDGRTAATNNQSNWIGDGWSMEPGYVERKYVSCTDDTTGSNTTAKVGDLCWKKDNAVLNLNGHSNVLVKDDNTGQWHLESDDGTTAEKLTSTTNNNGDNDGEYWKVTTPDGTQYYFGYNRPTGWAAGKDETNSTWTVPVFGNQTGEPCNKTAFADSWCQQAWRWNLDAVVDPHGDAMTYYWAKESNSYGRDVNPDTGNATSTPYDRGGYLKRIEYGLRSNNYYATPAAKVDFTVSERCLATDCTSFDKTHAANWPDIPFDEYCATGVTCTGNYSPSFWTRKRLTQIDTSVLVGTGFKPVDTWALTQQFPSTGDGTDPALWLASITRTGHTGTGDTALPAVTFMGEQLANRVEGATTGGSPDPVPPMIRYRVYGINTESGSTIGITYSDPDCKAGDVLAPASNTRRCYPVIWSPPDAPAANYEPYLDWFHTYVVTQVLEQDNTGGAPAKESDYTYLDGMGWAKDEDEFTKAKYLTYGDRKGYGRVQVRTGAGTDARTLKEYRYFRGIDGAQVTNHDGVAVTDRSAFAGMTREEATYDGDGGKLLNTTSYEPWSSEPTATMSRAGLSALKSYATGNGSETDRTAVGAGWRTTQTDRTYDGVGQLLTESRLGDTAKTGDEECATTTYAAGALRTLIAEVKTVAKPCGTVPSLPADLISDERHYYDGATSLTTAPTKGDVTRLEEQDTAGTGYLTTATHTYDQHGRELTESDALGNTTTTAYTPATVLSPTSKAETNALGQTSTTEYDPTRGIATGTVDPNGKRTDAVHDGLGRVLQVWQPGWTKASHPTQPSTQYSYLVSRTAANVVTSKSLKRNGDYATTYTIYDGLLRPRETQTAATGTANRLVTETLYDSRGFTRKSYSAYYADGAPSATLVAGDDSKVPAATENTFDGTGRVTAAIARKYGAEQWRTTTVYDGDRTTVVPPQGGTATTKVTDALGRQTELLQYTDAARTASQSTTYTYGKYDTPVRVTDPAGNTWSYTFDNRGQQTVADDPDKGRTTTTYDDLGRAVTTTDARGVTLTTGYDKIGRKTSLKQGSTTLASWTYDTLAKGRLTSSSRFVDGAEYTTATGGFNDRYQPTSTQVTIPAAAGGLAGSYSWTYGYNAQTGTPDWTLDPAIGDIPSERVTPEYNSDDLPIRTTRAGAVLASNTTYDVYSRPVRTEFGDIGKKVYESREYDDFTGRLTRQTTDRDLAPQRIDDTSYSYDPSGNITNITTASGQDSQRSVDTQCFTNDALGQLTEAWTAKTDCATAPSASTVGGPDAYWQSFSYDAIGNRTQQTEHGIGTSAGTDAVTTYVQPTSNTGLPHAVQQASVKGGAADGQTSTFGYDQAGNTTKRTIGGRVQDLTWNAEGDLATVTEGGKTTSYLYDADGARLIAKNADGTSTLTLPGDNELTLGANGTTKTGVRYYTQNGETIAVRSGASISYLFADHQGTSLTAVNTSTLDITRRKQLPFGQARTASSFPGTQGFVGGTTDPTGLVHLGAREYDPALGRFLSVDPVIDFNDPAQLNAYSYAHNNPVTKSDASGMMPLGPTDGGASADTMWAIERGMTAGYVVKNGKYVWVETPKKDTESRQRYTAYRANPAHYLIDDGYAAARDKRVAEARAKAQAIARAKAAEAQRRKKDGIFGSLMKGHFSDAWENTKDSSIGQAVGSAGQWVWDNRANIVKAAAGAAFVACTVGTVGVCSGVAFAAYALSITNRGIALTQSRGTGKDWAAFGTGALFDTIGWRVNAVRAPGLFVKSNTMPLLSSLFTRSGQARLYQQTSALVWGTTGW